LNWMARKRHHLDFSVSRTSVGFKPETCGLWVPFLQVPPQSEKAPMKVPFR
jgi:hypothetical protein